jgi:hypothetical protein
VSYFTLGVRALAKYHRAAQADKMIPADLLQPDTACIEKFLALQFTGENSISLINY